MNQNEEKYPLVIDEDVTGKLIAFSRSVVSWIPAPVLTEGDVCPV